MGMGGGSSGGGGQTTTTTTNTNEPFEEQKAVLTPLLNRVMPDVADRPLSFYPDETVVGFSPETEAALGLQTQQAFGSPGFNAAQGLNTRTLQGDFLNQGNPAWQGLVNRIGGDVSKQVNSQFAGAGRLGSNSNTEALSRGIGDAIAPIAFANYEAERGRQQQGIGDAQNLQNQGFVNSSILQNVGTAREGLEQQRLNEQINRFNFGQTEPQQRLGSALGLANLSNFGGTSTSTSTGPAPRSGGGSGFGQAAGLGLQAASLFK